MASPIFEGSLRCLLDEARPGHPRTINDDQVALPQPLSLSDFGIYF
jgi:hypothetical protein